MRRARPRQHLRRLKSGRIIKVNSGIRRKNYGSYVGFTPKEEAKLEKVFNENPRLKFIRDRVVTNIYPLAPGDTKGIYLEKSRHPKEDYPHHSILIDVNQPSLKNTLRHELRHGAHYTKDPKGYFKHSKIDDVHRAKNISSHGLDFTQMKKGVDYFTNPREYISRMQEDKSHKKEYINTLGWYVKFLHDPEKTRDNINKSIISLKKSPPLRDKPIIWKKQ